MFGSLCILFQVPAVLSKKVYILLALVVFSHNANVLVKVLTLLFTQISTVLSKCDHRKCRLTDICAPSWQKLFGNSWISPLYYILWWFSRKFITTDFSDYQADSSASLSVSSNIGPSWVLLSEGRQIYQRWISPCLSTGTSPGWKQTCCLPCPLPSQSSPLLLTWYVRVKAVLCSVQQGETERYASRVLTFILMATLV